MVSLKCLRLYIRAAFLLADNTLSKSEHTLPVVLVLTVVPLATVAGNENSPTPIDQEYLRAVSHR